MELKASPPQLVEHVTSIWIKQANSPLEETDPVRWSNPTYPYTIRSVDQVFPSREHLEIFESRRNELDQRLSHGRIKLETIHGFYSPSSEENLRLILREGFHGAIMGELTFCTDPLQAIRESLAGRPLNKLILARVSLGWKEYDYTEINNKYRIKNLRGVIPSFVLHIDQVVAPREQTPAAAPKSPLSGPLTSYERYEEVTPPSPTSPGSNNVRLPKYITDLGN